jgi:ankyrin repeat protein
MYRWIGQCPTFLRLNRGDCDMSRRQGQSGAYQALSNATGYHIEAVCALTTRRHKMNSIRNIYKQSQFRMLIKRSMLRSAPTDPWQFWGTTIYFFIALILPLVSLVFSIQFPTSTFIDTITEITQIIFYLDIYLGSVGLAVIFLIRGRPIHVAARLDMYEWLRVHAAGNGLNSRTILGSTPLHIAVGRHNVRAAEVLVAAGADARKRDIRGKTAWDIATKIRDPILIRLLMQMY